MVSIPCAHCNKLIQSDADNRLPPWCQACGADLNSPPPKRQESPPAPEPNDAFVSTPYPSIAEPPEPKEWSSREPVGTPLDELLLPTEPPKSRLSPFAGICAAVCGLIPIVTLGGAIPAMIGACGVSGCLTLGSNPRIDPGAKAGACVGIVLICWVALVILVGGLANLMRPVVL